MKSILMGRKRLLDEVFDRFLKLFAFLNSIDIRVNTAMVNTMFHLTTVKVKSRFKVRWEQFFTTFVLPN